MKSANEQAAAAARAQVQAQVDFYPQMEALQLGTIGKLSGNLNNDYTQQAKGVIDTTLQQGVSQLSATGARINQLGALNMGLAADAYQQAQGPTALDYQIQRQGARAMSARADQVALPDQTRSVNGNTINASQIGPISNVASQQVNAAQMGMAPGVRSSDFSGARMAGFDGVSSQNITASQMGMTPNVQGQSASARSTEASSLASKLFSTAENAITRNGQLSAEELRNAGQQASAAYSSRGLGTGAGAAAAEILNRDKYARARTLEDRQFAQNVQIQDDNRLFNNTQAQNQFALANQGVGMQAQLANQQVGYNTNLQNAQLGQQANQFNAANSLQAALANQSAGMQVNQANAGFAQQAGLSNQDAALRASLANQQVGYNTSLQNAQLGQQAGLANQDAALRAALANQGTSLSLGQANAGFSQQAALANQGVDMQGQLANQSADQTMNAQRMNAQGMNQAANQNQLAANRDFLMNANTAGINSGITRGNYAASLLGQTANLYGQAGGAYQNATSLGFGGANALVNLDPYQRAMGIGVQLGSGIQSTSGQMIGNAFSGAQQMAGNVASFNANMMDSRYNSAMNNNAALSGASSAANGQMLGAGIGAAGMIGMGAIAL
jgi:hypothetical protein